MARGKAVFIPALEVLQKLGRAATCAEIAAECDANEDSVNGAFLHHIGTSRHPLIERMQSKVYRPVAVKATPVIKDTPKPKAKPQDDLFEALGTTADGTIIVRGVNTQTMYRLGAL